MTLTKNGCLLLNSFLKRKEKKTRRRENERRIYTRQSKQILKFSHPTNIIIIHILLHPIIVPRYNEALHQFSHQDKTRQNKIK